MANKSITVFNSSHSGYRRAGLVFNKGDNVIDDATDAQIHAITNDKRLVLQGADKADTATSADLVAGNNSLQQSVEGDGSGDALPPVVVPPESIAFLVAIMQWLQRAGTLELTGSGAPTTKCLENAIEDDVQISAAMRDEAWNWLKENPTYQAEQESPEVDVTEDEVTDVETPETEPATSETSESEGNA
ncbi:HI1506-related protein [Psychromonas sp. MME2]|uniref:HI1506-related protein n=1 Tax=unclassified Psychromonas TaxID=2614957 RepID=UPI00339C8CD7